MVKFWDIIIDVLVVQFYFMVSLKLSYQPSLKFSMAVISTSVRFLNRFGDLILVLLIYKLTIRFCISQERCEDQPINDCESLGAPAGRAVQALQKDGISVTCAFISTLTYT